jgi:hypothetical protein
VLEMARGSHAIYRVTGVQLIADAEAGSPSPPAGPTLTLVTQLPPPVPGERPCWYIVVARPVEPPR